jgi:hypothetical protein
MLATPMLHHAAWRCITIEQPDGIMPWLGTACAALTVSLTGNAWTGPSLALHSEAGTVLQ